jgi:hypothetical protein
MFEPLHSPKTGKLIQAFLATSLSFADAELGATSRQVCAAFCCGAPPRLVRQAASLSRQASSLSYSNEGTR